MDMNRYQRIAKLTAVYPEDIGLAYTVLGLNGEAGEVAEKVKKIYRDHGGVISPETRKELSKELGDVLWYLAAVATELSIPLGLIAAENVAKLTDRADRNQLSGNGDNR